MLRLHVVLIEAHPDAGRVDLHQLAERILHAAADGNCAAEGGVVRRKFLAPQWAGGIDARPRFVDDHIPHSVIFQFVGHEVGQHLLGLTTSRAVADAPLR